MPASEFSAEARKALDRLLETRPSVDVAPLLAGAVGKLLDTADAWHEGYRQAGGTSETEFAHADGMDDAAVELVDTLAELLGP